MVMSCRHSKFLIRNRFRCENNSATKFYLLTKLIAIARDIIRSFTQRDFIRENWKTSHRLALLIFFRKLKPVVKEAGGVNNPFANLPETTLRICLKFLWKHVSLWANKTAKYVIKSMTKLLQYLKPTCAKRVGLM